MKINKPFAPVILGDKAPKILKFRQATCLEVFRVDITEITERTRKIIGEAGNLGVAVGELTDNDDLYSAGLTSRASVSVMLALEEEFDIEFPDHMLNRHMFQSIAAIRDGISTILDEQS